MQDSVGIVWQIVTSGSHPPSSLPAVPSSHDLHLPYRYMLTGDVDERILVYICGPTASGELRWLAFHLHSFVARSSVRTGQAPEVQLSESTTDFMTGCERSNGNWCRILP